MQSRAHGFVRRSCWSRSGAMAACLALGVAVGCAEPPNCAYRSLALADGAALAVVIEHCASAAAVLALPEGAAAISEVRTPETLPESVAAASDPTRFYLSGKTTAEDGTPQWTLELREAAASGRRKVLRQSPMSMMSLAPISNGSLFYMGRVGQYEPSGRPKLAWFLDDLRSPPRRVAAETRGHLLHATVAAEHGLVFLDPGRSREEPLNRLVFRSTEPGARSPVIAITRISPERTFAAQCSRDGKVCIEATTAEPLPERTAYRTRLELHRPQGSCGVTIDEHLETLAMAPDGQASGYVSVVVDDRRRRVQPQLVLLKVEAESCFSIKTRRSLADRPRSSKE